MINHSNKKDELRHARDTGHNRDYYYEKIKKKQKLIFFRVKLNIHTGDIKGQAGVGI